MIEVGKVTVPLVEAWRRFSLGDSSKADFQIILADLLDNSLHGMTPSFAVFMVEQKNLTDYPLNCALVAAKQEIGRRIIMLLNYTEEQTAETRRLAKAATARTAHEY